MRREIGPAQKAQVHSEALSQVVNLLGAEAGCQELAGGWRGWGRGVGDREL